MGSLGIAIVSSVSQIGAQCNVLIIDPDIFRVLLLALRYRYPICRSYSLSYTTLTVYFPTG